MKTKILLETLVVDPQEGSRLTSPDSVWFPINLTQHSFHIQISEKENDTPYIRLTAF